MINFSCDWRLPTIRWDGNFHRLDCENDYRVYGLALERSNPPILITCNEDKYLDKKKKRVIKRLLNQSGIPVVFKDSALDTITIGLRKDVRNSKPMSIGVIKSIIHSFENEVVIKNKQTILGLSSE